MKKLFSITLTLSMVLTLLGGCSGRPAVTEPSGGQDTTTGQPTTGTGGQVKTGLSVIVDVSESEDASAGEDGAAQADIALVAVTVGDGGVIDSCAIDMVQATIGFDAAGHLSGDPATTFASKNELGDAYGMRGASSIGREWNEQAAAMADYAVGKTVDELKGIAVNEKGAPADGDLSASVTISILDFISGIENAVGNARHLGAKSGDQLKLVSTADMSGSQNLSAEGDGLARVNANVAAVTFEGDIITSCWIDAAQIDVNFGTGGVITTDLEAEQLTKNQLGDSYGMRGASSIGKEWYEQAAAFSAYVTGKTPDEVASIAVNEYNGPADGDLSASVTISIADFQTLIAKAAQ